MSRSTVWRSPLWAGLVACCVCLCARGQELRTVRQLLAAIPDDVQSVVVLDQAAYNGEGSAWAPFQNAFEVMAMIRLGATDRPAALTLLGELKPRRVLLAVARFRGPSNDFGVRAVEAVAVVECPLDIDAIEVLRKNGAIRASMDVPAGWVALSKVVTRPEEPEEQVTSLILVLPGGLLVAGTREEDVRHTADGLVNGTPDSDAVLNRRWGKAAALISETAMLQMLREFGVREERVIPLFGEPRAEGDARNVLHFVVPSAGKLAGELHAYTSVRGDWGREALLGPHTKFEATHDGFVLYYGEIPADCADIQADTVLMPLSVFGVPIFI